MDEWDAKFGEDGPSDGALADIEYHFAIALEASYKKGFEDGRRSVAEKIDIESRQ